MASRLHVEIEDVRYDESVGGSPASYKNSQSYIGA